MASLTEPESTEGLCLETKGQALRSAAFEQRPRKNMLTGEGLRARKCMTPNDMMEAKMWTGKTKWDRWDRVWLLRQPSTSLSKAVDEVVCHIDLLKPSKFLPHCLCCQGSNKPHMVWGFWCLDLVTSSLTCKKWFVLSCLSVRLPV